MTTSTTTLPVISKPAATTRGKSAAQGVLAIAPTSRSSRAQSAGDAAKDAGGTTFADALKDAGRSSATADERKPTSGSKDSAKTADDGPALRDQVQEPRDAQGDDAPVSASDKANESKDAADETTVNADDAAGTTTESTTAAATAADDSSAAGQTATQQAATEPVAVEEAVVANQTAAQTKAAPTKAKANATDPLGLIPRSTATSKTSAEPTDANATGKSVVSDTTVPVEDANPGAKPERALTGASQEQASPLANPNAAQDAANATSQDANNAAKHDEHGEANHAARETRRDAASHAVRETQATSAIAGEAHAHDATSGNTSNTANAGSGLVGLDAAALRGNASKGDAIKLVVSTTTTNAEAKDATAESLGAQAARGLAAAFKHKGGTVTLNLTPETLGQIKVKITLDDAKVSALIQTSTEQAKRMLEQSGDALRTALESKGLSVDRLQITHVSPTLSELREASRGSSDTRQNSDGSQQQSSDARHSGSDGGSNSQSGHGNQHAFEDQAREQARAWREPRAAGMFDVGALTGTNASGTVPNGTRTLVGTPVAMDAGADADVGRVGHARLIVDAMA